MKKAFVFVAIVLICSNVQADTIIMNSGEALKGLVVEEHWDRVVVSTYKGEITAFKKDIDQVFFETAVQNLLFLGNRSLEEGALEAALGFYQKAYQVNPDFPGAKDAAFRAIDAKKRAGLELSPEELLERLRQQVGIGIAKRKGNEKLEIVSLEGNSPAHRAGLQATDLIVAVWDGSVCFMEPSMAARLLVGAKGTPVKLTIERKSTLSIKRPPPHSRFRWVFDKMIGSGYGLWGFALALEEEGLTAIEVETAGKAHKAGLRTGDLIVEINGESTRYMSLAEARLKVFPSQPAVVVLTIRRPFIITRQ